MLLDIIRDILKEMNPSFSASDTLSDSICKEIKDLAKKLFLKGKSMIWKIIFLIYLMKKWNYP